MTTATQTNDCKECKGYGNIIWNGHDNAGGIIPIVSKCLECKEKGVDKRIPVY